MKILIVDDAEIMLLLMQKFVTALGHQTVLARDGQQAIDTFEVELPDLVLMDMMMPVMDGPEAAARIKALAKDRWVPIVFVTAIGEENRLADAIEQGADDYLLKPINFRILEAKIKAIERSIELHQKVREQSSKLADYYERAEEEKRVARHLMEQMVNADRLSDPALTYSITPAESLSGDLIAAARTPGHRLYIMLADGIGHGLTAALNVLPLTQPFYTMTEKGFSVPEILAEINSKIRQVLPIGRFVAVSIASIDPVNRQIEVWNGGMPDILFFDANGNERARWKSHHLPLGILPSKDFNATTAHISYEEEGWLFFCSDGLIEARRGDGTLFGIEPIYEAFRQGPGKDAFARLQTDVTQFMQGLPFHDDVSLAMVRCTPGEVNTPVPQSIRNDIISSEAVDLHWRIALTLGPNELRRCSVVPLLMEFVKQIDYLKASLSDIFLILSELFNNALDHGLLEVPSALKTAEAGMDEYLRIRSERLEALIRGEIDLELSQVDIQGKRGLRIFIRDSGSGFDFTKIEEPATTSRLTHGRGIRLVKSLASYMEYAGNGNEVVLYFIPRAEGA
ncbi:CheY-like chemotaxis protein/anti-sigma regulatory factor (Ser/Thr protein kinase) [Chitinivorax tropicus]|uniref:CheY-like chemotaxis protein/anti-sigma regulatory factor (Ser/Thr protein kinase) n=1 Tax=Chitinivorax tropicus TaxID=714531 RepID=A0A840MXJ2_9PROT|nr:fused response regulator/phosphatase [Chitinivorax tropicus]MBB5019871.1 CheY-like chemotaxis protein/anti-sigma regulatory factor (Ser/Thr protein kinase) [Chitinivorax tropicus]